MLVAGSADECDALATQLADVQGVTSVLTAKDDGYSKGLAEPMAPLAEHAEELSPSICLDTAGMVRSSLPLLGLGEVPELLRPTLVILAASKVDAGLRH